MKWNCRRVPGWIGMDLFGKMPARPGLRPRRTLDVPPLLYNESGHARLARCSAESAISGIQALTDTKAMASQGKVLSQSEFLVAVRSTLAEFIAQQSPGGPLNAAEIEFPSASLDANAIPRFHMTLPASLICNDLGAASVFYDDVAGRGFEFALRLAPFFLERSGVIFLLAVGFALRQIFRSSDHVVVLPSSDRCCS